MIAGIVTVAIKRLSRFGTMLAGAKHPYALGTIQGRPFGRSGQLSDPYDLDSERSFWFETVAVETTQPIEMTLRIIDDRGDDAPLELCPVRVIRIPAGWTTGSFEDHSASPTVEYIVSMRPVMSEGAPAHIPRVADGTHARATLGTRAIFVTELTKIDGLYKPAGEGGGVDGSSGSDATPGYRSQDHLGRIYVNRAYDDRSKWRKGYQAIRCVVRIDEVRGKLPAGARVLWRIQDRDDPSNDRSEVHAEWQSALDPGDCDASGRHVGAKPSDNEGEVRANPRWEQSTFHTLTVADKNVARTLIVAHQSEVIIHCPDLPGDNLNIIASVDLVEQAECFAARSGTMTMWSLINVEVVRMDSAASLSKTLPGVQPFFDPAFIQFDFSQERTIDDESPLAKPGANVSTKDAAERLVKNNFSKRMTPGWFCLVSAIVCEPNPSSAVKSKPWRSDLRIAIRRDPSLGLGFFYYSAPIEDVDGISVKLPTMTVYFPVFAVREMAADKFFYGLEAHTLFPHFSAAARGDASQYKSVAGTPELYGIPVSSSGTTAVTPEPGMGVTIDITLNSGTSYVTSGFSPIHADPSSGATQPPLNLWWGATIVFTKCAAYIDLSSGLQSAKFEKSAAESIAHELVHGMGLPHCCGFYNLNTPRQHACQMQYGYIGVWNSSETALSFLARPDGTLPHSSSPGGSFCGHHIKELRRTRLHEHRGFFWHDKQ